MLIFTVYIDTGVGQTNPVTLTFVTSGNSYSRSWKVRVSQIPCSTIYRAEEGCLQYFTGVSGQIKSFNYDPTTGLQLSNQDYSICIRMERNFCGIQYMACPDGIIYICMHVICIDEKKNYAHMKSISEKHILFVLLHFLSYMYIHVYVYLYIF